MHCYMTLSKVLFNAYEDVYPPLKQEATMKTNLGVTVIIGASISASIASMIVLTVMGADR